MSTSALGFSRWLKLPNPLGGPGLDLSPQRYDATAGLIYPFGDSSYGYYLKMHEESTALIVVVTPDADSPAPTDVVPEASFDAINKEYGPYKPSGFTAQPGQAWSSRWGIDVVWPYWRFSLNGGRGTIGVAGIPRGR